MEITKDIKDEIIIMYNMGYTTGEIAQALDIPEVEVVKLVHKEY